MESQNHLGQYAGFTSRLIAYSIDLLIPVAGIVVFWLLIEATLEVMNVGDFFNIVNWVEKITEMSSSGGESVLRGLVVFLAVWGYHVFFLTLANRTIGKAIMGLQVVPLDGGRIGVIRASIRFLGYIISIIPLFLGFIWILFSRQRQGWHDKIARTCVVYSWNAKPDEEFLKRATQRLQKANEKRYGPPPESLDE